MHLQEKTVDSNEIFSGKVFDVHLDKAELENGDIVSRELILHPGGVCVVALTDQNEVLMVKQFRYPFQTQLIEVPAGKLEKGEDHRNAALRELKEETGAECESLEYIGVCYPSVAYLTEKIHMYLARGLSFGESHPDDDEFLDVMRIPFDKAVDMVMNGELPDAKTQIALLKARIMLSENN